MLIVKNWEFLKLPSYHHFLESAKKARPIKLAIIIYFENISMGLDKKLVPFLMSGLEATEAVDWEGEYIQLRLKSALFAIIW